MSQRKQCVVSWIRDANVQGQQSMMPVTCLETETILAQVIHKLATGGELEWFEQAVVDTILKNIDSPTVAVEIRRMW